MNKKIKFIPIVMQILLSAKPTMAASLGSLMSNAASDLTSAGVFGLIVAGAAGIFYIINGFISILKGQQGGGFGKGLLQIIVGVCLLSLASVILATSGTFTNNGASTGLSKLGIGG